MTQEIRWDGSHVYHQSVIRSAERDALGVSLDGDLPHTEQAAREILSLPMYPELTEAQLQTVSSALAEALEVLPSTAG